MQTIDQDGGAISHAESFNNNQQNLQPALKDVLFDSLREDLLQKTPFVSNEGNQHAKSSHRVPRRNSPDKNGNFINWSDPEAK